MNIETEPAIYALISTASTPLEETAQAPIVVTKRGALLKNRHGKVAPDNRLGCDLLKMTVSSQMVQLYFPAGQCCDMQGAICLATSASPSIATIYTWSGDQQDTCYQKTSNEWSCAVGI